LILTHNLDTTNYLLSYYNIGPA